MWISRLRQCRLRAPQFEPHRDLCRQDAKGLYCQEAQGDSVVATLNPGDVD